MRMASIQSPIQISISIALFGCSQWVLEYWRLSEDFWWRSVANEISPLLSPLDVPPFSPLALLVMAYLNIIATDLIYHIMLRIRGRDDLLSFILSCHCVHETFKEHPNSILRQVVCNEFNLHTDAFLLAWEVAGLQQVVEESAQRAVGAISDDKQGTAFTASEYKRLGKNHAVILNLAKKFSIQCKDSTRLYDSLSLEEYRRFEQTAYTFWRLQLRYHARQLKNSQSGDEEHEQMCTDLAELDTSELFRLETLKFLLLEEVRIIDVSDALSWVLQSQWGLTRQQCRHHMLSVGLGKLEDRLQEVDFTAGPFVPSAESREHLWFADALREVIESREVNGITRDDPSNKLVLEQGPLLSQCKQCCRDIAPHWCYNITNPEEIEKTWSITDFPGWWFSKNPIEMDRVCRRILGRPANGSTDFLRTEITIPLRIKALKQILEHATKRATQSNYQTTVINGKGSDSEQSSDDNNSESGSSGDGQCQYRWKPHDVLCPMCFRPVLQNKFYEWWIDERMSDRVEPREWQNDCWFGNNCRMQRKKQHARKLNHCCPQTRASSPLA